MSLSVLKTESPFSSEMFVSTYITACYLKPKLMLFMETHPPVSSFFVFGGRIYISTALLQKVKVGADPKGQCLAIDIL